MTDSVRLGVTHRFHGGPRADINWLTGHVNLDPSSGFPPFKPGPCQVVAKE